MPNAAQQHYVWHTKDELAFIAQLAAEAEAKKSPQPLEIYARALRQRTNWSGLDRAAIAAAMYERGFPL